MSNEDTIPQVYKYAWSAQSELSLSDFLSKYKPSMVKNDGTKPWIWVRGADAPKQDDAVIASSVSEASELLKTITDKIENIKNDDTIPVRSSKKTGAKSKKEVREQVQADATEKLKAIALKHGYLCGKWLIFTPADKVDMVWNTIATSLVSGPLHETSAYLAKVATSIESEGSHPQQHLICVYMPNVYDKGAVTEVMKILLRNHGVNLSGVKSDLYTHIGLDSKHSSGIPSTVWKNTAILPDNEIKELKEAFFTSIANKPVALAAQNFASATETSASTEKTSKLKPKLKKKANDDPFASDDESSSEAKPKGGISNTKNTFSAKAKAKKTEDFEDDDDDRADEEQRKKELAVKKQSSTKRAKPSEVVDSDDEPPKKKRIAKQ